MKGRIERLEEKNARNGRKYLLITVGGQNYSLWDGKAFDGLREGDLIEYEWKTAGDYRNITDIQTLDEMPSDPPTTRDVHILKMSCLKSASAILSNLDGPPEERVRVTIDAAKRFERYITGEDLD